MEHRNIRRFELTNFVADESENAMAMILHPSEGEPLLISFPVLAAAEAQAHLTAALQQIAKELGRGIERPLVPEKVERYNAQADHTDRGEPMVLMLIEGERSIPQLSALTPTDARRLAALLSGAAESVAGRPASRQ